MRQSALKGSGRFPAGSQSKKIGERSYSSRLKEGWRTNGNALRIASSGEKAKTTLPLPS
jgi:hypothetical protein